MVSRWATGYVIRTETTKHRNFHGSEFLVFSDVFSGVCGFRMYFSDVFSEKITSNQLEINA